MPTVEANGVTLHYLRVGSGPDLIMLHGLSGNLASWHLHLVPLLESECRITTYDLRGHGRSSMPARGYTTREMAQDLCALMDALTIDRADLLGHSFGADIALHFALLYPERARRLALIEPGIPALVSQRADTEWEGWTYWATVIEQATGEPVPPERRTDVRYLVRRSFEVPVQYGPLKGLPRRKDRVLKLLEETSVTDDYLVVDELTIENLATLPHPKLLVYDGASAWLTSFSVLQDVLTNCTPAVLPGSEMRHFAPLEAPAELVEHLTRFLTAEDSSQRSAPAAAGTPS